MACTYDGLVTSRLARHATAQQVGISDENASNGLNMSLVPALSAACCPAAEVYGRDINAESEFDFGQERKVVQDMSQGNHSSRETGTLSSSVSTAIPADNPSSSSSGTGMVNNSLLFTTPFRFEDIGDDFLNYDLGEVLELPPIWEVPDAYSLTRASSRSHTTQIVLRTVQNTTPVSRHASQFITRILGSYPKMMLRRTSLPPFIHPFSYRQSDTANPSLPEPLAICMSIASMFAVRTSESSNFLWRTIKTEQQRLTKEVRSPRKFIPNMPRQDDISAKLLTCTEYQMHLFTKEETLAAIQATIIYIIMRVVDYKTTCTDLDLHMFIAMDVGASSYDSWTDIVLLISS